MTGAVPTISAFRHIAAGRPRLLLVVVGLSAAAGWLFSVVFDAPLFDAIVHGVVIGTPFCLFERGVLLPRLAARIRRRSTPLFLAATLAILLVCVVAGNAAAALVLWLVGLNSTPVETAASITPDKLVYAIVISGFVTLFLRVRDLLGPDILVHLLLGRYHRPIEEDRLFLFLDLAGSTHFAERHGDLRAQEFLGRIFDVLAGPVRKYGGSIDDYVGDMAIVTWRLDRGIRNAAAIRCLFDFLQDIEIDEAVWLRDFDEVPRFRAALHGGSVVTAEIGLDRHKITYFGDVVNTTSRIEALGKSLGQQVLVSKDLLDRLCDLPDGIAVDLLGSHVLRGRDGAMAIASLKRGPPALSLGASGG